MEFRQDRYSENDQALYWPGKSWHQRSQIIIQLGYVNDKDLVYRLASPVGQMVRILREDIDGRKFFIAPDW